jgi:multicomponent Na+:H+ antiporter subunit B
MKKVLAIVLLGLLIFLVMNMELSLTPYGEKELSIVSDQYVSQGSDVELGDKNAETGSANAVTSIVTDYRSFDTLGEVTVLFVSALGVSLITGVSSKFMTSKSGYIQRVGSKVILPLLMIVGLYVITHGHLSPGGGFQGGAMIASAFLLAALSDETFIPEIKAVKLLEGVSGTIYVLIGLFGLLTTNYFLNNFLDTGVVGELFSAGIIPIIYLFIGLKVGSELTGILSDYMKEEV